MIISLLIIYEFQQLHIHNVISNGVIYDLCFLNDDSQHVELYYLNTQKQANDSILFSTDCSYLLKICFINCSPRRGHIKLSIEEPLISSDETHSIRSYFDSHIP